MCVCVSGLRQEFLATSLPEDWVLMFTQIITEAEKVRCRVQNKFCGVAITEMCVKWDGTVLGYNMVPSC